MSTIIENGVIRGARKTGHCIGRKPRELTGNAGVAVMVPVRQHLVAEAISDAKAWTLVRYMTLGALAGIVAAVLACL